MLTWVALLALSGAVLIWPHRPARVRVARLRASGPHPGRHGDRLRALAHRPRIAAIAGLAAAAGLVLAGPAGAVAAAVAAGTAAIRWRTRRRTTLSMAATADLATTLGLVCAELRAGCHPAFAAERAAADAGPAAASVLGCIAATGRLGGDVAMALGREALAVPALQQPLGQLAAAWELAERHGIPLADVLDAVRGDLDHRVRAHRRLHASLAGPRATAAVLAGLPVLGLLLGQAVGGQPWRVLTGVAAGQALLLLGVLLLCGGLAWSARLVSRAAAL